MPSRLALALVTLMLLSEHAVAQDWTVPAAHFEDAIVRLVTSFPNDDSLSICTGVIVNDAVGYVAAVAHCFPPNPLGSSIAANDKHAERIKVNHVLDLAVLQVKDLRGHQARLRSAPSLVGLPVAFVGFGFGSLKSKITFGWLSDDGDDTVIQARALLDVEALSGMSGGGIFDQDGALVSLTGGVVATHTGKLSYGPRPQVLADFLKPYLPKAKP